MDRPRAPAPVDLPQAPRLALPPGAADCHAHLIGEDFALWDGRVEDPPPGPLRVWVARYRAHLDRLGFQRGVVVHSILYGADTAITVQACRLLGPGFVGIGLITDDATEADLDALVAANIRGVRLNYVHGGVLSWDAMRRLAPALAERGLHVEMLAHSHLHLSEIAPHLARLPVDVVFDHCAWPDMDGLARDAGQDALRRLLETGQAWVKLSALYRFGGTAALLRSLVAANPERCLWGSDWPHLMLNGVAMPDAGALLNDALAAIDPAHHRAIFCDNPAQLYRF